MEQYIFLNKDNFKFPENQLTKLIDYINDFKIENFKFESEEQRKEFIKFILALETYTDYSSDIKNDNKITLNATIFRYNIKQNKNYSYSLYAIEYFDDDNNKLAFSTILNQLNDLSVIITNKNLTNNNYYYYLMRENQFKTINNNLNTITGSNGLIILDYYRSEVEYTTTESKMLFDFHFGLYNLFLSTYNEDSIKNDFYVFNQESIEIKTPNKIKRSDKDYIIKPLSELKQDSKKLIFEIIKYKQLPKDYANLFSYKYYIWSLLNDNIEENSPNDILGYTLPETVTIPTDFSTGYEKTARETAMYFLNPDKITVKDIDETKTQTSDNIGIIGDTNNDYFIFIYDDFNNEKLSVISNTSNIEFNSYNIIKSLYINYLNKNITIPTTYNKLFIYNFGYNIFSFLATINIIDDVNKVFIYNEGLLSIEKAGISSQLSKFQNVKSTNILQDPIVNKKIGLNKDISNIVLNKIYNPNEINNVFIKNPSFIHTLYGYDMLIKNS